MNLADTAIPLLLVSLLGAGCGSRSGLDCFGESCQLGGTSSVGVAGGGGAAGEDEDPPPVIIPPRQDEPPDTPSDFPSDSRCGPSSTFVGSVLVDEESDLEVLVGCGTVEGDLTIQLFGDDLGALRELRTVTGTLQLSQSGNLEGLENLGHVGNLVLEQLDVPTLRSLGNLQTIGVAPRDGGELRIDGLVRQRDLEGLGSLQQVREIFIVRAGALESLDGLAVPGQVDSIMVLDSPAVTDISALTPLTSVEDLTLQGLGISNLTGLHNLAEARTIALLDLPALSHIRALQHVERLRSLELRAVALAGLAGLEELRSVTDLVVQSNPDLRDMNALSSLERLSQMIVTDNPFLQALPGIEAVDELQRVNIERNPLLAFGPYFPGVTDIAVLTFIDNPSLLYIEGFSSLQRARSIEIRQNSSLDTVNLQSLTSASALTVTCNPALPESSLEPLRAVSGVSSFSGNLGSAAPCGEALQ